MAILVTNDKGEVHLIDKSKTLDLQIGDWDSCYISIDNLDVAIALLQAARQKLFIDSPLEKGI